MRNVLTVAVLVVAAGLVGCKKNQRNDAAQLPPPQPIEEPLPPLTDDFASEPAPIPVAPEPIVPGGVGGTGGAGVAGGTYTVQRGDTLYGIARKVYGDPRRVRDIIAANPGINPNLIKVGQQLILPQ